MTSYGPLSTRQCPRSLSSLSLSCSPAKRRLCLLHLGLLLCILPLQLISDDSDSLLIVSLKSWSLLFQSTPVTVAQKWTSVVNSVSDQIIKVFDSESTDFSVPSYYTVYVYPCMTPHSNWDQLSRGPQLMVVLYWNCFHEALRRFALSTYTGGITIGLLSVTDTYIHTRVWADIVSILMLIALLPTW